jgi:hypothetical protein
MKRDFWIFGLVGFAVTALLGTVLHFLYDFTGGAAWIAPFSGVNESTWEHMKLMYWPMTAFAVAESFFFRGRRDFWWVKLRGTLLGLTLIPVIFYTYNGVIGRSPDWVNIAIFFVSAAAAYVYETSLFKRDEIDFKHPKLAAILLFSIGILFIIFTFHTPEIGVFKDPVDGSFGI